MKSWIKLNTKIERLDKRLDALTATPSRSRTNSERGQISILAKQKLALLAERKRRRDAFFAHCSRIGLGA